jgi:hypothetical protein
MTQTWYHIYDPVIVTKKSSEKYWMDMDHEFFFKNVIASPLGQIVAEKQKAIQALLSLEFLWIKALKPTFFIAPGIVDFVNTTRTDHSAEIFGRIPIFAIAWHPKERFAKAQLPPILIAPQGDRITIQWQDDARKGTETAFIPRDVPLKDLKSMMSPLGLYIAQTVLGIMTYMQAFPDLIVPGLPRDIKTRCSRYIGNSRVCCLILHDNIRTAPSSHLRVGHWRALKHERFKRNADGSIKIIYVNPTIVGFITPYSVEIEGAEL